MIKSPRARAFNVALGLLLVALTFAGVLTYATRTAEAGCRSSSVCTYRNGRSFCSSSTQCAPPRIRSCSFVNRCYPQRDCHSSYGRTTCVTRDICRREQVCY